jgi:hypothetical protein
VISDTPFRWTAPSTWPWVLYVWVALVVAGFFKPIWRWVQRERAISWPTAIGEIDSVAVGEPKRQFISAFPRNRKTYAAEISYTYAVGGQKYSGTYRRDFGSQAEASEFIRELRGKPVSLHYNPDKPSKSVPAESSIETLLRSRPPRPADELALLEMAGSVPEWVKPLLWPFIALSAIGLVVSLWAHLGTLMGRRVAPEAFFWILHVGIFIVWFPAVVVAQRRIGGANRTDYWKVVLRGSPDWMRYMVYGFFAYAIINFVLFMANAPSGASGANPPANVWRGFSGHWMAFYSAALAIIYSAATANSTIRRCINGHPLPATANFCARCGQPAMHR